MSGAPAFPFFPFIIFSLPLIALGAILLRRSFWPKRQGTEPHCRACGYLLIGLDHQRCPECGITLSPRNIVHGRRHRRAGLGAVGVLLLLLGLIIPGSMVAAKLFEIDWYHLKPTFLVMRDLRLLASPSSDRAIEELNRRDLNGELTSANRQQIIELALTQQGTTGQTNVTTELLQFLERQFVAGGLSDVQKTRFGEQCVALSLRIRPKVIAGNWVPFEIDEKCRVTGSPLYVSVKDADKIEIDGVVVRQGSSGGGRMSGLGVSGSMGDSVKCPAPGKHTLRVTSRVELDTGMFNSSDPAALFNQRELTGTFEVVASSPPNDIVVNNDPALAGPIRASITPAKFCVGKTKPTSLQGTLQITSVPTDIAFDVYVRTDGTETRATSVAMNKGGGSDWQISQQLSPAAHPSTFDLILRSSVNAAIATVDIHSIWQGELIYRDIPISIDPSR